MTAAAAVREVELSAGPGPLAGLGGADRAFVLLRWRGVAVAAVWVPVAGGAVEAGVVARAAERALGAPLDPAALEARRAQILGPDAADAADAADAPPATVVVPTRDRPDDLARCLTALRRACPGDVDLLVVDNAPRDDRAAAVAERFGARRVVEPAPGLNRARAAGARAAARAVVLYADDDTEVDPGWYDALRRPFAERAVGAACGLVLPRELDTEAQRLFESPYGGFVKRFRREVFSAETLHPVRGDVVGAGASFAVRRALATDAGVFDVLLDGGTRAGSGGDTYALYRVLRAGHQAVFTPAAVTWHRHRRSVDELRAQLVGYGAGTYAFLTLALLRHAEPRALADMLGRYPPYFARLAWDAARGRPDALPWALATAEARGVWRGVRAGARAALAAW